MRNVYKKVTQTIIKALRKGVVPWVKPWKSDGIHRNALTGREYRGINILILNLTAFKKGFASPLWLTYREAKKLGGHVKTGEKGTHVIFWKFYEKPVLDEENPIVKDQCAVCKHYMDGHCVKGNDSWRLDMWEKRVKCEDVEPKKEMIEKIPFARFYTVFNVEQCEGLKLKVAKELNEEDFRGYEKAEKVLELPDIRYGGNRAYYDVAGDYIRLPFRRQFKSPEHFYATALHELIHWTGHPTRLNREFGRFGDKKYALEELVAEIGAAFLEAKLGIKWKKLRHPGYIKRWVEVLEKDKTYKAVFSAARKAQEASEWVLERAGLAGEERKKKLRKAA